MAFKLTSKDIAALEEFLTRYQECEKVEDCASFYGINYVSRLSVAVGTMRAIGMAPPTRENNAAKMHRELAELREWKRSKEAEASGSTLIRGNGLTSWTNVHPA